MVQFNLWYVSLEFDVIHGCVGKKKKRLKHLYYYDPAHLEVSLHSKEIQLGPGLKMQMPFVTGFVTIKHNISMAWSQLVIRFAFCFFI